MGTSRPQGEAGSAGRARRGSELESGGARAHGSAHEVRGGLALEEGASSHDDPETTGLVTKRIDDAPDHTTQLERLADATHRVHAALTARAALDATVEAARAVLGAEASISIDHTVTVASTGAGEPAAHEQVLELPSPHAPSRGTLTLRRALPFDRAEVLIASQIARATALVLERHRLVDAVHVTANARQEIVTIVSHDLRTPVHAFALGLDALRATVRSEAATPIFARLDRSLRSMRRLLSDLLDVATIQDGALPLHLAAHPIAALLGNVQAGSIEIAKQKGLAIVMGHVASGTLWCDGTRVEQALTNLVGNALKYTERGTVTLSATDEGDALCFEVSDTGIGMDADVRAHLFERLYQGPRARAGGVGLGLYIVRGIADAHGGSVAVTSRPSQGSRFFMRIPQARTRAIT
jgi:signal transduction histidine kinase